MRVGFGWRACGRCHVYCTRDGAPGEIEELSRAYFVAGRWHFLTVRLEASGTITAWSGESPVASGRVALPEGATAGVLFTAFYGGATEDWAAPVDAYLDLGGFSVWSLTEASVAAEKRARMGGRKVTFDTLPPKSPSPPPTSPLDELMMTLNFLTGNLCAAPRKAGADLCAAPRKAGADETTRSSCRSAPRSTSLAQAEPITSMHIAF